MKNGYRPDIDGLRAVAVLTILLYHIGFSQTPGGFVGVDIFFVISGFLITRNILSEIQAGTFSFADFYTRRARRLLPAFFFTLAASIGVAFWLFSPAHFEQFGASLLYALLSVSNFFFWREAGYFDSASELKPLLHTWSLSVEEQFYLIWPALLVLLSLARRKYLIPTFITALGFISLYLSQRLSVSQPSNAFFLLPTRIFEFAIGAACVWFIKFQPRNKAVLEVLALIGLAMIIWATGRFNSTTLFPSYHALIPCIGTALLIYAGQAPLTGLLLRNPIAVGLGRISYSVYLIHWPLIVFYKYWLFTPISDNESWALLALSIIFGAVMWKFIETPFRSKAQTTGTDSIRFAAPMLALLLSFVAASIWGNKGFPSRFPAELFMTNDEISAERSRYWTAFDNVKASTILDGTAGQKRIVIMGNSHGVDLVYAMRSNGLTGHITFLQTGYKCFNFGTPLVEQDSEYCASTKMANLSNDQWSNTDFVFLHDHWPKSDMTDLRKTLLEIRRLTSAKIYVFGPKMTYSKDPFEIAREHRRLAYVRSASLNQFSKDFEMRSDKVMLNNDLKQLLSQEDIRTKNIYFVDMLEAQCGSKLDECGIFSDKDSKFLYFDASHFTARGAAELGTKLKEKNPKLFE